MRSAHGNRHVILDNGTWCLDQPVTVARVIIETQSADTVVILFFADAQERKRHFAPETVEDTNVPF